MEKDDTSATEILKNILSIPYPCLLFPSNYQLLFPGLDGGLGGKHAHNGQAF